LPPKSCKKDCEHRASIPFFAVTKSTESNMRINYLLTPLLLFATVALAQTGDEKHLTNIKQLTFGGDNAEAYFSFDSKYVSFQSNNPKWGLQCEVRPDFLFGCYQRLEKSR